MGPINSLLRSLPVELSPAQVQGLAGEFEGQGGLLPALLAASLRGGALGPASGSQPQSAAPPTVLPGFVPTQEEQQARLGEERIRAAELRRRLATELVTEPGGGL